jgi:hypothetical protein
LVVEHVADNDLGAFSDEEASFGSPLSSRTAGNQRNFTFESIHRICLANLWSTFEPTFAPDDAAP